MLHKRRWHMGHRCGWISVAGGEELGVGNGSNFCYIMSYETACLHRYLRSGRFAWLWDHRNQNAIRRFATRSEVELWPRKFFYL